MLDISLAYVATCSWVLSMHEPLHIPTLYQNKNLYLVIFSYAWLFLECISEHRGGAEAQAHSNRLIKELGSQVAT